VGEGQVQGLVEGVEDDVERVFAGGAGHGAGLPGVARWQR
jgi:hypothetical protein